MRICCAGDGNDKDGILKEGSLSWNRMLNTIEMRPEVSTEDI